ncbi:MAG: GMC oxidoreductase [Gemmatimonadales bacterium]
MLIDARELADGTSLDGDLVVIGGGIAGITLARELRGKGLKILVLESGALDPDRAMQDFAAGTGTMTDPDGRRRDIGAFLRGSRVRAYGGSGHVWGGKCGRLEKADFERRDWIPGSGWPFDRDHLDPFYDRASVALELPSFRADLTGADPTRPEVPIGAGQEIETVARFHSPVTGARSKDRFDRFRLPPAESPDVTICLGATVTAIETAGDGRLVTGLVVRTLNGKAHRARGRRYVLAAGGIENARILLLAELGNRHDLVGRHFGGHLNCSAGGEASAPTSGVAFASLPASFDLYVSGDVAKVWGVFNATGTAQRRHRIPNLWATFSPVDYDVPAADRSVIGLGRLGAFGKPGGFFPVRVMVEEPPNRSSRLTLVPGRRDGLDQPRVDLDWRLSAAHFDGIERGVAMFARALGRHRVGRLRWPLGREAILPALNPARHHLGTTRMSTNPRHGVVDADARMHGVENFYVAGSSIFPTTGIVNPTLTIVALTIRLADHLAGRFRGGR